MTDPQNTQDEKQGGLTARGEAVAAGYAALDVDGDDTLTVPDDQPADDGASDTAGEAETQDPAGDVVAPAGPADIPSPPVIETADADTSDVETRGTP